ncbi:MAG TPA: hypothetical protein VJJ82_05435 [Candidatus Nanoarchaeia archaeon]|nr:hypothetical protein [Candidatus Nanoarchaeia archaeon]
MENKEVVLIVLGVAVVAVILALSLGKSSIPTGGPIVPPDDLSGICKCKAQNNLDVVGLLRGAESPNTGSAMSVFNVGTLSYADPAFSGGTTLPDTPGIAGAVKVFQTAASSVVWLPSPTTYSLGWKTWVEVVTGVSNIAVSQQYDLTVVTHASKDAYSYTPNNQPGCEPEHNEDCEETCNVPFAQILESTHGDLEKEARKKAEELMKLTRGVLDTGSDPTFEVTPTLSIIPTCEGGTPPHPEDLKVDKGFPLPPNDPSEVQAFLELYGAEKCEAYYGSPCTSESSGLTAEQQAYLDTFGPDACAERYGAPCI